MFSECNLNAFLIKKGCIQVGRNAQKCKDGRMDQLWDIHSCFIGTKKEAYAGFDPTFKRLMS